MKRFLAFILAVATVCTMASFAMFATNAANKNRIVEVGTYDELVAAFSDTKIGDYIKLTADITVNADYYYKHDAAAGTVGVYKVADDTAVYTVNTATGAVTGALPADLKVWSRKTFTAGAYFDGQGHTITGLYESGPFVSDILLASTFKNVTFKDSAMIMTAEDVGGAGFLSCNVQGRVENVHVDGIVFRRVSSNEHRKLGGITGILNGEKQISTLNNVSVKGSVIFSNAKVSSVGGIVGQMSAMGTVANSVNYADVYSIHPETINDYGTAGIVGLVETHGNGNTTATCGDYYVKNVANYGDIHLTSTAATKYYAGGIVGFVDLWWSQNPATEMQFVNCYNAGVVIPEGGNIFGRLNNGNSARQKFTFANLIQAEGLTNQNHIGNVYGTNHTGAANRKTLAPAAAAEAMNAYVDTTIGLYKWTVDGNELKLDTTAVANDLDIVSVKLVNDMQLVLTFNRDVSISGSTFCGLRFNTGETGYTSVGGKITQVAGSVTADATANNKLIWKPYDSELANHGFANVTEALSLKSATVDYTTQGFNTLFCFEGLPFAQRAESPDTYMARGEVGYVDGIQSKDHLSMLKAHANRPDNNIGVYDGYYKVLTPKGGETIIDMSGADVKYDSNHPYFGFTDVTLDSVKLVDRYNMQLTFSDTVEGGSNVQIALLTQDGTLAWGDASALGGKPSDQQYGATVTRNGKVWNFYYAEGYDKLISIADAKGWKLGVRLSESTGSYKGYVEAIKSTDGIKRLVATHVTNSEDNAYMAATGLENETFDPIRIVENIVLNDTQVALVFNRPIDYRAIAGSPNTWNCYRSTVDAGANQSGTTNGGVTVHGNVLIFNGAGAGSLKQIRDKVKAQIAADKKPTFRFVMEEVAAQSKISGYHESITARNDSTEYMKSNLYVDGVGFDMNVDDANIDLAPATDIVINGGGKNYDGKAAEIAATSATLGEGATYTYAYYEYDPVFDTYYQMTGVPTEVGTYVVLVKGTTATHQGIAVKEFEISELRLEGIQTASNAVRFIASLENADTVDAAGFEIEFGGNIGGEAVVRDPYAKDSTAAYDVITGCDAYGEAINVLGTADDGVYYIAVAVKNLPTLTEGESITMTVKAYIVDLEGNKTYTAARTVTYTASGVAM